jgi:hypothetical protein
LRGILKSFSQSDNELFPAPVVAPGTFLSGAGRGRPAMPYTIKPRTTAIARQARSHCLR